MRGQVIETKEGPSALCVSRANWVFQCATAMHGAPARCHTSQHVNSVAGFLGLHWRFTKWRVGAPASSFWPPSWSPPEVCRRASALIPWLRMACRWLNPP
jgi:hypothetical protein